MPEATVQAAGPTVRSVVETYLRHCAIEEVHGPDTAYERAHTFALFLGAYGDLAADQLRPFHLTDFIESHPTWRSAATRRLKACAIKAAFRWAHDQERVERNPFRGVRYSEAERRPDFPDNELSRLTELANKPFERAARFLRLTGARLSELCYAVWSDIDMDRRVWSIDKHKSRRYTKRTKVVVLVDEAVELLKSIQGTYLPTATGTIFLNSRGTPWNRRTLGQHLRRMKARHGITTPATLHGLRHRLASAAIGAGAPIKLIAEQLGHSSVTVTERSYYCRTPDHDAAIRSAVELGTNRA